MLCECWLHCAKVETTITSSYWRRLRRECPNTSVHVAEHVYQQVGWVLAVNGHYCFVLVGTTTVNEQNSTPNPVVTEFMCTQRNIFNHTKKHQPWLSGIHRHRQRTRVIDRAVGGHIAWLYAGLCCMAKAPTNSVTLTVEIQFWI